MTLYIDTKLNFSDINMVSTVGSWHPSLPLLAVGSYNQEKGGFVTIFQENVSKFSICKYTFSSAKVGTYFIMYLASTFTFFSFL